MVSYMMLFTQYREEYKKIMQETKKKLKETPRVKNKEKQIFSNPQNRVGEQNLPWGLPRGLPPASSPT